MIKAINDFAIEIKLKYGVEEISVYTKKNGKPFFETGVEIDALLLEKYFSLEKPQYFASEGKIPLKDTLCYYSRLVYNTCTSNGLPILFVVSSKKINAFDECANILLKDMLNLKQSM